MTVIEQEIEEDGCAWVSVNGFAICISTTSCGVIVEIHDEKMLDAGYIEGSIMATACADRLCLTGETDGTV